MTDLQAPFDVPAIATALTPAPPGGPAAPAVVAFYLPQYHRIPENDAWWGEGFTDWQNVTAAKPLYPGHVVPNLPGELGAYDLLSRDVRSAQAKLAREHGVYGFCYYYYWFGGRRLLERPLELMLEDGQPDLPFALCWANEPWTRRWDGREQDVLMPQHHDRVRDLTILDDLMPYFEDPRYIHIDGRPLLLVYRQGLMPDAPGFAADLRAEAVRRGLPGLFLCNVLSIGDIERCAPGFDAAVEFPPHGTIGKEIRARDLGADRAFRGHIYDYASTVMSAVARPAPSFPCFPGVMPRWDNTARKGLRAHVFHGSTPQLYERWLRKAAMVARRLHPEAPLLFVNSWNEWAEGAHLEPDERLRLRYLEAIGRTMAASVSPSPHAPYARVDVPPGAWSESLPRSDTELPRVGLPLALPEPSKVEGVAWIDEVDGCTVDGLLISVPHGQVAAVRGWYDGSVRPGERSRRSAFLVLLGDGTSWHVPLETRHLDVDALRGFLSAEHRSRRFIRVLDRLPSWMAARLLQAWWRRWEPVGFNLRMSAAVLPAGLLRIGIMDVAGSDAHLIITDYLMMVSQPGGIDAPT